MSNISIFTLPGFWVAYESVDLGLSGFGDTEAFARPAEALTGPRTVTSAGAVAASTVFSPGAGGAGGPGTAGAALAEPAGC